MNLLSVENLTKAFGLKTLFKSISFGIEEGEKIGVIGVNGTGKTTLLKILAGVESPDEGKVITGNTVRVAYLPQNPVFNDQATVLEQAFQGISATAAETWLVESELKTVLTQLGILDFSAKIGMLSGGRRKRVALAGALANPAELLILDEPTNHIDNDTVAWLEQYLNKRKGALLMVTHDRYFLDRVTNRIIELDKGRLFRYTGNYSKFLELKLAREEQEQASEAKRLNLLRNELKWIKRGAKARSTKQKARIDRFEKLQADRPEPAAGKLEISAGASRLGKKVIALERVNKAFSVECLISDFSCIITRDARVGVIGPNGIGKSTLLNIIAGRTQPDGGSVDIGPTVKIGLFSQESLEMNENQRVIDYIKEAGEFLPTAEGKLISAGQMLERFLFPSDLQWAPITKISGGERRRLYLLRVLMEAPNVLLLDEPTNDLDIQTLTILEDYLDDFPGAVVAVSHDRYFLDRVVDRVLAFSGEGRIDSCVGNYSDYLATIKRQAKEATAGMVAGISRADAAALGTVQPGTGEPGTGDPDTAKTTREKSRPLKFTFKEQKEYEQIDEIIAEAENELTAVNHKINCAGSDFVQLQQLVARQKDLQTRLDQLLDRWAYLNDLAEQIEKNKSR